MYIENVQPDSLAAGKKVLALLLLGAALVLTANAKSLSLLSLDDCFYARKGVELGRSGRFFTVTWNYQATFQNPPLQFWILGRCFQWFGENDLAARLPSILMGLGILAMTYRVGKILAGDGEALTAVCALLLTPQFVSNARRCMLEIPTTFWILLCIWILLEGMHRPRVHLLIALSLGGGLLTKSVLGLLPIPVFAIFCIVHPPARASLRKPWLWLGVAGGLAIGASWPIHEWLIFGPDAIRQHYLGEIASRSMKSIPLVKRVFAYPLILLGSFQPVILPAIAGAFLLWKRRREAIGIVLIWAILPVLLYSLSSAQSSRYVFPSLPALALCAGCAIERLGEKIVSVLCTWITPAVLILLTLVLWIRPEWIVKNENRSLKEMASVFQRIPEMESIVYLGNHYWQYANPILYYTDRFLESPLSTPQDAMERTRIRESRSILCDRDRCDQLLAIANQPEILFQTPEWQLILLRTMPH